MLPIHGTRKTGGFFLPGKEESRKRQSAHAVPVSARSGVIVGRRIFLMGSEKPAGGQAF
jgi:hypothetical protein